MATITDPSPGDFASGATPTAAQANDKVLLLDEANGRLDLDNLKSGFKVQRRHLQRGSISRGKSYGANANLDYVAEKLWPNYATPGDFSFDPLVYENGADEHVQGINELRYLSIPGCSADMYNVFEDATRLRLSFRISYFLGGSSTDLAQVNDLGDQRYNLGGSLKDAPLASSHDPQLISGILRLFVNGEPHPFILKRVRGAYSTGVPSQHYGNSESQNLSGHPDFQVWDFTAIIDASVVTEWGIGRDPLQHGRHTASLRIFHTCRNIRLKTRFMDWTYLK